MKQIQIFVQAKFKILETMKDHFGDANNVIQKFVSYVCKVKNIFSNLKNGITKIRKNVKYINQNL